MRYLRPSLVLMGIAVPLTALSTAGWAADDLAAVFARIDKAAPGFKGFSADIRKVKHTPIVPDDDIQTGTAVVRRAKPHELQMRIDFNPPDKQTVAVDGTKVEIYYPSNNTIQPVGLGKSTKPMLEQVLMLGWGSTSAELKGAYDISYGGSSETSAGQKADLLILVPKDKDLLKYIPKFELWVAPDGPNSGVAIQVKVHEKGGDYSTATYSNMKLRSPKEDEVKLKAPKNAERLKAIKD
jgi:outer membrane lipoprotein-sorting protein